ncbi:chemotaxis protein CheW [Candidatus Parabeggiatoa sp. HSG14]|uniref:chemotaxis protein CheW n=1 Tax=Candidatus Parabeggiatoa sp. HSG14 TaxID=3055593 RepID=UPI0025A8EFFE|nr:chemotaxis protein CheW [Thiotrichales bacterium HSG14]
MTNTLIKSPFQWLQDLERRTKQRAKGLPRDTPITQIWRGIAFRLREAFLITPLNEIHEVLYYPSRLAKVPGAKSWVKGLANIRGRLLPVIDLNACLEGNATTIENRSRILIINQSGVSSGLLVDEVLGIKHFPEHIRDLDTPCKETWIAPFAKGLFTYEDITWTVFDVHTLVENELFLNAAL